MSSEPGALGIRQSRTIECVVRLTNQDVISARKRADSVAKSAWCIEAHGANGVFLHYIQDDYYDIPYGTLVPVNLDNLTVCGRLLCAEHEALASARVSAQCLLTGYAAGTASSLSMETGCAMKDVDVERLQTLIQYEYGDK